MFVRAEPGLWENSNQGGKGYADRFLLKDMDLTDEERSDLEGQLRQTCDIRYLWVDPDHRRRQVARLLISHAERWCRDKQYRHVQFAILPELQHAIYLAENMGFQLKSEPSKFDRKDAPESLIFTKDLGVPSPSGKS